jgi:hypothetical protein
VADKPKRERYSVKQIALILEIEERRVRNFVEAKAYGIDATEQVPGRRLFDYTTLQRFAIATELVRCGFSPESVGVALQEIRPSDLAENSCLDPMFSDDPQIRREMPMLISIGGSWTGKKGHEVKTIVEQTLDAADSRGLFVLNFPTLLRDLVGRIEHLEIEGKLTMRKRR